MKEDSDLSPHTKKVCLSDIFAVLSIHELEKSSLDINTQYTHTLRVQTTSNSIDSLVSAYTIRAVVTVLCRSHSQVIRSHGESNELNYRTHS